MTLDHKMIANQLMTELVLSDIKNNKIEKCSFGQQKRVVMAMELNSRVKPNLICADEPTSGVDSYSALLVKHLFEIEIKFLLIFCFLFKDDPNI